MYWVPNWMSCLDSNRRSPGCFGFDLDPLVLCMVVFWVCTDFLLGVFGCCVLHELGDLIHPDRRSCVAERTVACLCCIPAPCSSFSGTWVVHFLQWQAVVPVCSGDRMLIVADCQSVRYSSTVMGPSGCCFHSGFPFVVAPLVSRRVSSTSGS